MWVHHEEELLADPAFAQERDPMFTVFLFVSSCARTVGKMLEVTILILASQRVKGQIGKVRLPNKARWRRTTMTWTTTGTKSRHFHLKRRQRCRRRRCTTKLLCDSRQQARKTRAKRSEVSHGLRKRKPQAAEQSDNGVHRARCEVQGREDQCLEERSWTVHRRQGFCHTERSLRCQEGRVDVSHQLVAESDLHSANGDGDESCLLQKKFDLTNINKVASAVVTVVNEALLFNSDKQGIIGFMQNGREIDDDDDLGVPIEAVYKSHSSDVVNILEHVMEKAHARLDAARQTEADAAHTFALLRAVTVGSEGEKALEEARTQTDEHSAELPSEQSDQRRSL